MKGSRAFRVARGGDVADYTLRNVIIDNYFFGLTAFAVEGSESAVVYPGAEGSFDGYTASNAPVKAPAAER